MSEISENKASRGSISQIILMALNSGDKYGYEICKDIEKLTKGKLILKQPSLYSSLRRMEKQNLISSYWQDGSLGGKRHFYSVTEKGREFYDKNKTNWLSDDDLINSLPENLQENILKLNKKPLVSKHKKDLSLNNESKNTLVLKQENLFNITHPNKEIKRIENETDSEKNDSSFFQFDIFEQNVSFVKKNLKKEQNIPSFSNKYSALDEHKENIEPVMSLKTEAISETSQISTDEIETPPAPADEIFEAFNDSSDKKSPVKITKDNEISNGLSIFTALKNMESFENVKEIKREEVFSSENTDVETTKAAKKKASSILFKKPETMPFKSEIKETKNDLTPPNTDQNQPVFETNDYRSVIGKLYNNSQLSDPYEANKFQTFKEIFPSSQLSQKSAKKAPTQISDVTNNINCDDVKMLNNLFNLQGINIKTHNSLENKKQSKIYTDKNKLNMFKSWFVSLIMLLEIFFCYIILKENHLILSSQTIIYFLSIALTISYCVIATLENTFERFKLVVINKNFNKSLTMRLLFFILIVIAIFAINLVFGMNNLQEIDFLSYWLLPVVLSSNIVISCLIYLLLLKSKNFNS